MSVPIELRAVTAADRDLLFSVYVETRDDARAAPWSAEERTSFLEMQFEAQRSDYEVRFPNAEHSMVLVHGEPQGRIWIDRGATEIRLLDIALLPEQRNRGTGTELLQRLIAEAKETSLPLRHSVYKDNEGALRFYERLGFEVVEDHGLYVLMEWVGS